MGRSTLSRFCNQLLGPSKYESQGEHRRSVRRGTETEGSSSLDWKALYYKGVIFVHNTLLDQIQPSFIATKLIVT